MCVIAYKKRSVKLQLKTIWDMFETNPHGAGIAVIEGKKILIKKGYFDPLDMWEDLKDLQGCEMVLHFRWATHGQINERMCHPFVIDPIVSISSEPFVETDKPVLFHNGVLTGYGNKEISDTCDLVTTTLAKLDSARERAKLLSLTYSKYILVENGKVHLIGDFKKHKGLKVSNTDFIPYKGTFDEITVPSRQVSSGYHIKEDGSIVFAWDDDSNKNG